MEDDGVLAGARFGGEPGDAALQEALLGILRAEIPLVERLERFCHLVARQFDGGVCSLYLNEADPERARLCATSRDFDPLDAPTHFLPGEGQVGWVSQQRRPLLLSTSVGSTQILQDTLPVETHGDILGILTIEGRCDAEAERQGRRRIEESVELLGSELAAALLRADQERELARTRAVQQAAERMRACGEAAELHHVIVASAAMMLETEHAVLRLCVADHGDAEICAYFGSAEAERQAPLFGLEKKFASEVMRSGRTQRSNSLDPEPHPVSDQAEVSNLLVEAITVAGRVLGTLSVLEKHSGELVGGCTFNDEDAESLKRLALQASRNLSRIDELPISDGPAPARRRSSEPVPEVSDRVQLGRRLDQELALEHSLVLIQLRVEGLGALTSRGGHPQAEQVAHELIRELAEAMCSADLLARTEPDNFAMLIPEPDEEIPSLIGVFARCAGAVLRRIPERSAEPLRLEFGYARSPEDGRTRDALIAEAEKLRVRSFV